MQTTTEITRVTYQKLPTTWGYAAWSGSVRVDIDTISRDGFNRAFYTEAETRKLLKQWFPDAQLERSL